MRTLFLRDPMLEGDDVKRLQKSLGMTSIDGVFGPRTEQKLIAFQIKEGLDPDGIAGPLTLAALYPADRDAKNAVKTGQGDRLHPDVVVRMNVACQSSRNGTRPLIIVLHSTESQNIPDSIRDLQGIGDFFNRLATQASSHVATDADGQSARYVPDDRKAWTCAGFNPVSLNIEQIGLAAQKEWKVAELRETARWIAHWSLAHGIPITPGAVSGSHVTRAGVVYHSQLGSFGGGHSDPGGGYPLEKVLDYAFAYRAAREGKAS